MTRTSAVVVAVAAFTLCACSAESSSVTVTTPAGASSMTLRLGTDGSPNGPAKVEYTCPGIGPGPVCGPEVVNGKWTKTVTAPAGMQIWIHAVSAKDDGTGTAPNCSISDDAGQKILVKSDEGSCVLQVRDPAAG